MAMAEQLTPERVAEMLDQGVAQVIDVREDHEHEAGHVTGDRHVVLPQLSDEAASLDRDRPVVVYCRTGSRAEVAAEALRASGYDAYNLEGGFVAWLEKGLPAEPEGAVAARQSVFIN
jgi:rhodanese-related sulfurtransferase